MKIVSLCPSITESVFRLGKGDELVGRTKFCVRPHGRVDAVERVGGTKNPKVDRIVELRPDVVLMNDEENRREDADAFIAAGLHVVSTFAIDVPTAARSLEQIGAAIGASEEARRQSAQIMERAVSTQRRASFVYLIWRRPYMAVGPDTYVSGLLTLAGGDNVVRAPRYPEVDVATIAKADRVLLSSEPFPFKEAHRREVADEAGLPIERIQLVDGELLSWHGARTLEGMAYASRLFDV